MSEVWFLNMVPVPGTSLRIDRFATADGWKVAELPNGILLHRPAVEAQNIPEVPPFRVVGIGYSIVEPVPVAEPPAPEVIERVAAEAALVPKRGPAKARRVPEP